MRYFGVQPVRVLRVRDAGFSGGFRDNQPAVAYQTYNPFATLHISKDSEYRYFCSQAIMLLGKQIELAAAPGVSLIW